MHPHTIYIEFGYGQRLALTQMQSGVPAEVRLQRLAVNMDSREWADDGKLDKEQLRELLCQTSNVLHNVPLE